MKAKTAKKQDYAVEISFFDINQLELAFINRALENPKKRKVPPYVKIGRSKKILTIQKNNLMKACRQSNRERRKDRLENELTRIQKGEKRLSIACFVLH